MTSVATARPVLSEPAGGGAPRSAAAESLLARLDDPRTAAALHDLLDHAELLALVATMADGLLRRSETLTGNIADGLADVRTALTGSGARTVGTELAAVLPAVQALLASRLLRPDTVAALDTVAAALVEGLAPAPVPVAAAGESVPGTGVAPRPGSVRGLLATLRDPATGRGLAALLGVARALGRRAGR